MTQPYLLYMPSLKVKLHLHEPLWRSSHISNDIAAEMISLCSLLEQRCLSRDTQGSRGHKGSKNMKLTSEAQSRLLCESMQTCLSDLHVHGQQSPPSLQDYLVKTGLSSLFPRAMNCLSDKQALCKSPMDGYFSHLSRINQLTVMCKRLANDLKQPNHKYIAHQIALLYQCVNLLSNIPPLVNIKTDIETKFQKVKRSIEVQKESQVPILSQDHHAWLCDVTSLLLECVKDYEQDFNQPISPVITFLQKSHTDCPP